MGLRLLACLGVLSLPMAVATSASDGEDLFERRVRPILVEACYGCHSAAAEKLRGGLRLDSADGLLRGGTSGPAIVPGSLEQSLLIRAIRYSSRNLRMPPDGRLDEADVAAVERWVSLGAPFPGTDAPLAPASHDPPGHWSFRPVVDVTPPEVEHEDLVGNAIDRFVLARLEARGLAPAPEADRRTLLRRASFGLLGLPPTPEELDRFVADDAPLAWEREVDRLLASPHYGEHWGRHWLDLARYADTNGQELGLTMAHAWRYRDWVVEALNSDLSYDRFLTAQLAGDLLHPDGGAEPDPQQIADWTATGFLVLGPRALKEPDLEKLAMDVADEQIDTTSRTFMGVTLACARCHDHKFDPIPTRDYYALAGIFRSSSTIEYPEKKGNLARWSERSIASPEQVEALSEWESSLAALRKQLEESIAAAKAPLHEAWQARTDDYAAAARTALEQVKILEAEDFARSTLVVDHNVWGLPEAKVVRTEGVPRDQWVEYELQVDSARTLRLDARYASVEARPLRLLVNEELVREDALAGTTHDWGPAGQTWFHVGEIRLRAGNNVLRLERDGGVPHMERFMLSPPGLFDRLAGTTLEAPVLRNWADLVERTPPGGEVLLGLDPLRLGDAELEPRLAASARQELSTLRSRLEALQEAKPPPLPHVLAASEGDVVDLPIHRRGSHLDLEPVPVPRGVPRFLEGSVATPATPAGESGRLQLARWLTDPKHPLTARTIVNRVWQGHFGQGLVRPPSNLGIRGEAPTHPDLLDWLAARLIADGWSLKALHRRILLSRTYRMDSRFDAAADDLDPENRLLWRQNRRRLEAEQIRDALLAASGRLEYELGGPSLQTENRTAVISQASQGGVSYESLRRSLYLPVIRGALYPMFSSFDYVDASTSIGRRNQSVLPQQALFLMNSRLVIDSAEAIAERSMADEVGDGASGRVQRVYRLALGRLPGSREAERALDFLSANGVAVSRLPDGHEDETASLAWRNLAQALLASNEFLHVD